MITHSLLRTALKHRIGRSQPKSEPEWADETAEHIWEEGPTDEWEQWENPDNPGDTLDVCGLAAQLWEPYRVEENVENLSVEGWRQLAAHRRELAEHAARHVRRADTQHHIVETGDRAQFAQLCANAHICPSVWERIGRRWRQEDSVEPFDYQQHMQLTLTALRMGWEADWLHKPHDPCGLEPEKLFGFVDRNTADNYHRMARTRLHIVTQLGLDTFAHIIGEQRPLNARHLIDLTLGQRTPSCSDEGPVVAEDGIDPETAAAWRKLREQLGREWLRRRWEAGDVANLRHIVLPLVADPRTDPELRLELLAAVATHEGAWDKDMWVAAAGASVDCEHRADPYESEETRRETPVGYPRDMEALIAAAKQRGAEVNPWVLWVNGHGPQPGDIEQIVSRPPTIRHVIWSDHVEDDVLVEIAQRTRWQSDRIRSTIIRNRPHLAAHIPDGEIIAQSHASPGPETSLQVIQHVLSCGLLGSGIVEADLVEHLDWVRQHPDWAAEIRWENAQQSSAWRIAQTLREVLAEWIAGQLGDDPERWRFAWQLTEDGGWQGSAKELIRCVDLATEGSSR